MPQGTIVMWSGAIDGDGHPVIDGEPDTDWWLCDGANGRPDLTDRFVVGAGDNYAPGDTGGSEEQTLNVANLPSHVHGYGGTTTTTGGHTHVLPGLDGSLKWIMGVPPTSAVLDDVFYDDDIVETHETWAAGSHSHTYGGVTTAVGSDQAFSIMPPYYALAYIMYLPD
ncbi:hypothetical protein ACFLUT_01780 [Chloroflexota bacterium]